MFLSLCAAALIQPLQAKGKPRYPDSGLVYGPSCAFFLNAPKGWVLDNSKVDGLPAVFYPKGSTWKSAGTAMYARSELRKGRSFYHYIQSDEHVFLQRTKDGRVYTFPSVKAGDGTPATIVEYESDASKQHDYVAFFNLPKAFAMVVMTSRTNADLTKNRPVFDELVHSFEYLGAMVKFGSDRKQAGSGKPKS